MLVNVPILTFLFGLSARLVLGAPAESNSQASGTTNVNSGVPAWPLHFDANEGHEAKAKRLETNAERMRRGLGPLAPSKPYDSKRHILVPRVSPAPATYREYTLLGCANDYTSTGNFFTVESSSIENALGQCADGNPATSATFTIQLFFEDATTGIGLYGCQPVITSYSINPCTSINAALYQRPRGTQQQR